MSETLSLRDLNTKLLEKQIDIKRKYTNLKRNKLRLKQKLNQIIMEKNDRINYLENELKIQIDNNLFLEWENINAGELN